MAKIIAPNSEYTGVSATVPFVRGVGQTCDPTLIEWFRRHGYTVQEVDSLVHPTPAQSQEEIGTMPTVPSKKIDAQEMHKPERRRGK